MKKQNGNLAGPSNITDKTPAGTKPGKGKKKAATQETPKSTFQGDQSLVKSIKFMHEAMISHKAAYAVADGDIR